MFIRIAVATLVLGSTAFVVSPRGSVQPDRQDAAIAALVAELRGVRAELAEASQRALRFQLLLARLQLQEQRIGHLDRQRAEVSRSLMDTQTMTTMFMSQYQQFERRCADAVGDERNACESQMPSMKANAASHQAREQQLRLQEQELVQSISVEQGRWSEFSSRLDELERVLSRPQ